MNNPRKIAAATAVVALLLAVWAVSRGPTVPEPEDRVAALEREVDRLQGALERGERDLRVALRRVERLDRHALDPVPRPRLTEAQEVTGEGVEAEAARTDDTAGNDQAYKRTIQLSGWNGQIQAGRFELGTRFVSGVSVTVSTTDPLADAAGKLGLSEYQVRELRRAIAERDAAYRNAMLAEVAETEDGTPHVKDVVDEDRISLADEVFGLRLKGALSAEQEADWTARGFAKTFAGTKPMPRTRMPMFNLTLVGQAGKDEGSDHE